MVYIIAEIGKNSDGDIGRAKELVRACAAVGADAVRFSHFAVSQSVHPSALDINAERAWSLKLELPFLAERLFDASGYQEIRTICHDAGVDFVASPWDLASQRLFDGIGVTDYKINSLNAYNIPLVTAVLEVARRTYLSTGGLDEAQVARLVRELKLAEYDVVLMHAVTAYPAPQSVLNLSAVGCWPACTRRSATPVTTSLATSALAACSAGASVIDKHVHLVDGVGPAHLASVDVSGLARLVAEVREFEAVLGRRQKYESRGEMANRDVFAKGLVLARDVPAGRPITSDDLALQLPPKGLMAESWFDVVGTTTTRDLTEGDYLFSADITTGDDAAAANLLGVRGVVPGQRGVVVRLKDIDEMTSGRDFDYVEVHYAARDLERPDECADYDLDLVVHVPEYADGVLLDLCSYDEALRRFSIEIINQVMEKARNLRRHFRRCTGDVRMVIHPGALTHPAPLAEPSRQYALFADSMRRLDTSGIDVLVENMTPYAWFLAGDWSPRQGISNSFLDPSAMLRLRTRARIRHVPGPLPRPALLQRCRNHPIERTWRPCSLSCATSTSPTPLALTAKAPGSAPATSTGRRSARCSPSTSGVGRRRSGTATTTMARSSAWRTATWRNSLNDIGTDSSPASRARRAGAEEATDDCQGSDPGWRQGNAARWTCRAGAQAAGAGE